MTEPARLPPAADPLAAVAALPGVAEAVAESRSAVDALLRHRMLRARSAEVTGESMLRSARASAELDGAPWPLARVRAAVEAGGELGADPDARTVAGALRIGADLGSLVTAWQRAPRQVLARLHSLAAVGEDGLGRPRRAAEEPADPLGLGPAPDPQEVDVRLAGLVDLLTAPTTAPALVVAAVVHAELVTLAPFPSGNGLVARAAARLVLIGRGLDRKAVAAPEIGHVELREQYVAGLAAYRAGGADAVATWIGHCAAALRLGARDGLAICEALQRGA